MFDRVATILWSEHNNNINSGNILADEVYTFNTLHIIIYIGTMFTYECLPVLCYFMYNYVYCRPILTNDYSYNRPFMFSLTKSMYTLLN